MNLTSIIYRKLLPLLLIWLLSSAVNAQHQIARDVLGNGGGPTSSTAYKINGTIGQTVIGFTAAPSAQIEAGFWPKHTVVDSVPLLAPLPIGIGAAVVHVYNDQPHLFGGSTDWWAAEIYDEVRRLDGANWVTTDSIPDDDNWGKESVIVGDDVYLLNGYPAGSRSLIKYNLLTGAWTDLANSSATAHWGGTAAAVGDDIYYFDIWQKCWQYSIPDDAWAARSNSPNLGVSGMRSVVYNNEIYIAGFRDNQFHKYNPANDTWTELASPPFYIAGGAMELYRGKIYYVGGSNNGTPQRYDIYRSVLTYDFASDSWTVEPETISSARIWMGSAIYRDQFYVFGGFDSLGQAVDIVETIKLQPLVAIDDEDNSSIIPDHFTLEQNYPNPFNPTSTIRYGLPVAADVRLTIHNVLGQEVRQAVSGRLLAGKHEFVWDGLNDRGEQVASGIYFYRLQAGDYVKTRKMTLTR